MVIRLVEALLWGGLLWAVAVRPWALGFPEAIPLAQWVGLGVGLIWWIRKRGFHRRLTPSLAVPCLTLLMAFLVSSLWGRDRREIFIQGHGLVFGITLCAGIALAGRFQRRQLRWILVLTGTLLSLHALWQAFVLFPAMDHLPWSRLAMDGRFQHVPDHTIAYATEVIRRRRVFGPFPLPGLLAAALAMLLPMSVATLNPWATTSARRVISVAVWILQAVALLLTRSLGGIGSACAAALWVLVLRRSALRVKLAMLGVALLSVGMLLAVRPELSDLTHPRNPMAQRWSYWVSTVQMIREHPLRGIGAGNYASVYPRVRRPLASETRYAHNALLQVWAEWGALGAIGLVGLFIGSLRLAARQPMGHQVAWWAFWSMALIDVTWSFPQVACLWWVLVGLSAVPEGAEA